ncbi:AbrB family transcriptional regulator [Salmonella enterica subsp. enterica serovar Kentucky]|uniref:AbrB family transcriptional regulator n=1 Tax=Salmonella enterica TaxID=28901 RepID=UPI0003BD0357|nr:AbrB family transcriptional regulator [Salmonella enterica]EAW2018331.1 AbrB family transcriptional regulator [Salmonella enterica subsp. enterica]ELH5243984.1 AbrB family transcriptional regulator [Salmonella enterica subsp. enterica serovar Enteritidis]EAR6229623.1 AbrB family transcriptional regulator [Salmonella enterica]EAR9602960.1 AbrB family transcriptional regulator [Salmonella enterica]EAS9554436.1 AbrB family transcriptional regulator [Salmonella enterica]
MPILQWFLLFLLSLLISLIFLYLHLPAAMLLGPMIAGIVLSLRGSTLQLPRGIFLAAQAILGCMIAQNLTGSILTTLALYWPVVLLVLLVTLLSSAVVGWLLVRYSSLPGNTGAWGSSPGGAAVLVTRLILGDSAAAVSQQVIWFPPLSGNLLTTLLLAIVAGIAGRLMRIPSGTMLLPMLAGALLHSQGIIEIELPEWLLAVAYMAIGWRIGLGFDRQVFFMALRPLPQILLSIFALMAICAAMAWGMAYYMQIDFMTAYLATSPGGLDTVAAIAAGSSADMALIMAMQTLRLFSILLTGPAVARFISTYAPRQPL